MPKNYDPTKPYPVVIWFHWWGDNYTYLPYTELGEKEDFITVNPWGMADLNNTPITSWNVGDANQTVTCTKEKPMYCYNSCAKLNMCTRCNWATCYDDVHFTRELVKEISSNYCVDRTRLHASGDSNGGIYVYYLTSQLPELFKNYGLIAG